MIIFHRHARLDKSANVSSSHNISGFVVGVVASVLCKAKIYWNGIVFPCTGLTITTLPDPPVFLRVADVRCGP